VGRVVDLGTEDCSWIVDIEQLDSPLNWNEKQIRFDRFVRASQSSAPLLIRIDTPVHSLWRNASNTSDIPWRRLVATGERDGIPSICAELDGAPRWYEWYRIIGIKEGSAT
jgi:hypothetical protein